MSYRFFWQLSVGKLPQVKGLADLQLWRAGKLRQTLGLSFLIERHEKSKKKTGCLRDLLGYDKFPTYVGIIS